MPPCKSLTFYFCKTILSTLKRIILIKLLYAVKYTKKCNTNIIGKKISEIVKVVSFFVQIVVAMGHIHSKNVLHRDLKTQNLLIDRQARVVKISDFGTYLILKPRLQLGE